MALLPQDEQSGGDDLEAYAPSGRGGRAKKTASAASPRSAAAPSTEPASKGGALSEAFSGLRVSLMPSEIEGKAPPDLGRGLLMLALVLIVETVVIGTGYFFVSRAVDGRIAQRTALEKKIADLDDAVVKQELTAKEAAAYNGQVGAAKEALDKHVHWSKFFGLLEANTRPTIKYLNFSGDTDSGIVTLDAVGRTYRDVAEQIVAMREDELIADVRTTGAAAKISETGEVTGVSFTMVIRFKKEAWLMAQGEKLSNGNSATAPTSTAKGADCGLGGTYGPTSSEDRKAHIDCVEGGFQACRPTTYKLSNVQNETVQFDILGRTDDGRCRVKQTYTETADTDALGKDMTCALEQAAFISLAFARAADENFKNCTGPLVAYFTSAAR